MASDPLQTLADRVTEFLVRMGLSPDGPDQGPFLFRFGSTVVMVSLFVQGSEAYVRIASIVLKDFRASLDLVTRLLRLNTEVLLGAFLLFEDDTLSFAATLLGDDLSETQFRKTLEYVAQVSDEYDDELMAIVGGRRAMDLVDAGDGCEADAPGDGVSGEHVANPWGAEE